MTSIPNLNARSNQARFNLDEAVMFAENPEPRCPCVLLLDVSASMAGEPIAALNAGLQTFQADLNQDDLARKRVEVAIVSFNDTVQVVQDFITADLFVAPELVAAGTTAMAAAIQTSLALVRDRKAQYRANGVAYYRPWIFLITDGAPTDAAEVIEAAARLVREEEEKRSLAFFAVGVEGADIERLSQIASRTPLKLKGLKFQELFLWLSASMQQVSQSRPGDQVPLPSPAGWGQV